MKEISPITREEEKVNQHILIMSSTNSTNNMKGLELVRKVVVTVVLVEVLLIVGMSLTMILLSHMPKKEVLCVVLANVISPI